MWNLWFCLDVWSKLISLSGFGFFVATQIHQLQSIAHVIRSCLTPWVSPGHWHSRECSFNIFLLIVKGFSKVDYNKVNYKNLKDQNTYIVNVIKQISKHHTPESGLLNYSILFYVQRTYTYNSQCSVLIINPSIFADEELCCKQVTLPSHLEGHVSPADWL